ncbi:hypothetical protein Y032_0994g3336 [Ancylostoma ceylanicum]|uniref:Uncharacterized protein n=1 Tax=Ancylostoma ceylanicum TaxID=53326 RepID=A0A016W797_9BILA|nr:hypothetical protein Y032_0994g3336 [Ancylostoma ceylanicum]
MHALLLRLCNDQAPERLVFGQAGLCKRSCSSLSDRTVPIWAVLDSGVKKLRGARPVESKSSEDTGPGKKKQISKSDSSNTSNEGPTTSKWEFDDKDAAAIAKSVDTMLSRLKKSGALRNIKEEFSRLKGYIPEGSKQAFIANEPRNRYRDILLLDSTRVVLKNRG